jgi:hypothetical protein
LLCDVPPRGAHGGTDRATTTAQVDYDNAWTNQARSFVDQELGTASGDEHARTNRYPQAAKCHPAQQMFQRHARRSPLHHGRQFGRTLCCRDQELGFVFGEHTSRGSKPGDDIRERAGRMRDRHERATLYPRKLPLPISRQHGRFDPVAASCGSLLRVRWGCNRLVVMFEPNTSCLGGLSE